MRILFESLPWSYLIALAVLMMLLVGISRVYLGVHWPTDVLAGWLDGGNRLGTYDLADCLMASTTRRDREGGLTEQVFQNRIRLS